MDNYQFTLESAIIADKNNKLYEWLQDFLRSEGKNPKLADIITNERPVWIGLIEYDLNKLKRAMGPEPEMVFIEEKEKWDKRINNFVQLLKNGLKPCPIIASDYWDDIQICDGTHRFEALKLVGVKKYWTIFFVRDLNNRKAIIYKTVS